CVFFFQAEDGIRDPLVTGVQTCALPILELGDGPTGGDASDLVPTGVGKPEVAIRPGGDAPSAIGRGEQGDAATGGDAPDLARARSEERRVGKECRGPWNADH